MTSKSKTAPEDLRTTIMEGSRKRLWPRLLMFAVIIGLGVWAWTWWKERQAAANAGPGFVTQPVTLGNLELTVTATGNLEPTNEVTVGSELSGTTLEVYVDTNDKVTKGQPLAKLDTTKLAQQTEASRASVISAKARVEQAKATLAESNATLARQQELHRLSDGKIPSKADLDAAVASADRAKADLASAEAAVGEAEAQVRINESDLGKSIIRSPIDGIVLTRSLEPGQTVAASFQAPELFVIAERLEQMKLEVAIAEADIGRVENGQEASFTVDAWPERSYKAAVRKVAFGSAITDNVVTYETELEVDNGDLSLRPGMTATADIQVASAEGVLLVPAAALRFNPEAANAPAGGSQAGGQRPSFVQNLIPVGGRARRGSGGGQRPGQADAPEKQSKGGGHSKIYILRDGNPIPIEVKVGLNDGRQVEVLGEGLEEGLPVIVRAGTTKGAKR